MGQMHILCAWQQMTSFQRVTNKHQASFKNQIMEQLHYHSDCCKVVPFSWISLRSFSSTKHNTTEDILRIVKVPHLNAPIYFVKAAKTFHLASSCKFLLPSSLPWLSLNPWHFVSCSFFLSVRWSKRVVLGRRLQRGTSRNGGNWGGGVNITHWSPYCSWSVCSFLLLSAFQYWH